MPDIREVLDLERIDRDIYRGPVIESILQRTFGGQVAAQALVAATNTVDKQFAVHSLHAYFVGPGRPHIPTVYTVDRIRDGRSFSHRHVRAVQDGRTIFMMQASFHRRDDTGIEHSKRMPEVPEPEDVVVDEGRMTRARRLMLEEWSEWDIRVVPPEMYPRDEYSPAQQMVWFRAKGELPDDETFHVCTLAYMSDMTLLSSAKSIHKGAKLQEASLDHAMWFMRPFRADEWLLYDQVSPSAHAGRALTHGRIFNRAGELVAVVTQEGLTRDLPEGTEPVPMNPAVRKAMGENLD